MKISRMLSKNIPFQIMVLLMLSYFIVLLIRRTDAEGTMQRYRKITKGCYWVDKTIYGNTFDEVQPVIKCIKINSTALSALPTNATSLIIYKSNISAFGESPFSNFTNLKSLNFFQVELTNMSGAIFSGLSRLHVLELRNNHISKLPNGIFQPCQNLSIVDLSNNDILQLSKVTNSLGDLQNLKKLYFQMNKNLISLNQTDLLPLANTKIEYLDFKHCSLTIIEPNSFSSLLTLKHLILSSNNVNENSLTQAFMGLGNTSLEILEIRNLTRIYQFPKKALDQLQSTNIKVLFLSQNIFYHIQEDFPQLKSLQSLDMSQCHIKSISDSHFDQVSGLLSLLLEKNGLQNVPFAISKLRFLKFLDLSYNPLLSDGHEEKFVLNDYAFTNNNGLSVLFLHGLRINRISRLQLNGLSNLTLLTLSSCDIKIIEDFSFETLESLRYLDFRWNKLNMFMTKNTFVGLSNLKKLELSSSFSQVSLSEDVFANLVNLKNLSLRGNQLSKLPSVFPKTLDYFYAEGNELDSWTIPKFSGDHHLKEFALARNNLVSVTTAMRSDFEKVDNVDISKNPFNCSDCDMKDLHAWSNKTNVTLRNHPVCANPEQLKGNSIFDEYKFDHCILKVYDSTIPIIIAFSILLVIITIILLAGYYFRWYLRYWWFLSRSKVKKLKEYLSESEYQYDAFVSYNENNVDWVVDQLVPNLEQVEPKFKLCLHERDFIAGNAIMDNVVQAIEQSRKIVLVLSNNFLKSQWCIWEMKIAQFKLVDSARDILVLVILEQLDKKLISSTLRYLIRKRTYLSWPNNSAPARKLFWEKLRYFMKMHEKTEIRALFGLDSVSSGVNNLIVSNQQTN